MVECVVHVAAAVIEDGDGRVLLALRPKNKHQGGLWEFPGGKLESGESAHDALCREITEEVGAKVLDASPLIRIWHDYVDKSVLLDVWRVTEFSGTVQGCEGQEIRWVPLSELNSYDFPAANLPIVAAATLPEQYLITGDFQSRNDFMRRLETAIDSGFKLIQFRAPWLEYDQYMQFAREAAELSRCRGCKLLIKGGIDGLSYDWVDGIHLTSSELATYYQEGGAYQCRYKLLAASCHNAHELAAATAIGCRFATLSPILCTSSHPGAVPLGWEKAAKLTEKATLPVFWLGRMAAPGINNIKASGGQGAAAISAWW